MLRNPYWNGTISTIDLLTLSNPYQFLFILKLYNFLFYQTANLIEEVNGICWGFPFSEGSLNSLLHFLVVAAGLFCSSRGSIRTDWNPANDGYCCWKKEKPPFNGRYWKVQYSGNILPDHLVKPVLNVGNSLPCLNLSFPRSGIGKTFYNLL